MGMEVRQLKACSEMPWYSSLQWNKFPLVTYLQGRECGRHDGVWLLRPGHKDTVISILLSLLSHSWGKPPAMWEGCTNALNRGYMLRKWRTAREKRRAQVNSQMTEFTRNSSCSSPVFILKEAEADTFTTNLWAPRPNYQAKLLPNSWHINWDNTDCFKPLSWEKSVMQK